MLYLPHCTQGYKYALLRPVAPSGYATIVQVGGTVDLSNAISVPVSVPGQTWVLWVSYGRLSN